MDMTGKEFKDNLQDIWLSWLPARDVVIRDIEKRHSVDNSGEIMVMSQLCPWLDHLFHLEKELQVEPSIKFVIYEGGSKMW